jgi:hypothetical protein
MGHCCSPLFISCAVFFQFPILWNTVIIYTLCSRSYQNVDVVLFWRKQLHKGLLTFLLDIFILPINLFILKYTYDYCNSVNNFYGLLNPKQFFFSELPRIYWVVYLGLYVFQWYRIITVHLLGHDTPPDFFSDYIWNWSVFKIPCVHCDEINSSQTSQFNRES